MSEKIRKKLSKLFLCFHELTSYEICSVTDVLKLNPNLWIGKGFKEKVLFNLHFYVPIYVFANVYVLTKKLSYKKHIYKLNIRSEWFGFICFQCLLLLS